MNSDTVWLVLACIGAFGWIIRTALTDPVEAVVLLSIMYLTAHLTQRFRSRRGRLTRR